MKEHVDRLRDDLGRMYQRIMTDADGGMTGDSFASAVCVRASKSEEPWIAGPDDRVRQYPVLMDDPTQTFTVRHWGVVDLRALAVLALAVPAVIASKGILLVSGALGLALQYKFAETYDLAFETGCVFVAAHKLFEHRGRRAVPEDWLLDEANSLLRRYDRAPITMDRLRAEINFLMQKDIVALKDGCVTPLMELQTAYG